MPAILVPSASYVLSDHLLTSEGDHCYNLFKQMRRYGYEFEAISAYVDIRRPLDNVRTHKVGTLKASPSPSTVRKYVTHAEFLTRSTLKAKCLLKDKKIDIIHHMLPTVYNQTFSPLALMGKTEDHPFIMGPASAHVYKRPVDEKLMAPFTSCLHNATVKKTAKLIVLTEQIKKLYRNLVEEDKIDVIPFAVDTEIFKPAKLEEKDEILFVGSLYELKGTHHLIEAMAKVVKERADAKLRILGKGPLRTTLQGMIHRLKLQKNVTLEGEVPHDRIAIYYQRCSLLCFPTQGEPFGKAMIEAMACGKPVIATNVGGATEIVVDGKTGFLIPRGKVEILAERIIMLLKDEVLRKEMGRNSRKVVLEKYSWPKIAEKYHQVYRLFL